ncbi:MAG: DUF6015 family protein [Thermoplasmata archaeon]
MMNEEVLFAEEDNEQGLKRNNKGNDICSSEILSYNSLRKAICKKLSHREINEKEADKLTEYLLNLFGYDSCIIDNVLTASDRNLFYMLEEEGLMESFVEEVYIMKGRMWRIHYWHLRVSEIKRLSSSLENVKEPSFEEINYNVYAHIPDDVWAKR